MLKFLIGLMFGFIFARLLRYRQDTKRAAAADPTQFSRHQVRNEAPQQQSRVARLDEEREKLLSALDRCRAEAGALEKKLGDKTAALDECVTRRQALQETLAEEQAKTARLQERLESLQAQLTERENALAPDTAEKQQTYAPPAADDDTELDIEALKRSLPEATGDADDLKQIKGIGPVIEQTLNELGVTTFRQIALLSETQIDQVARALKVFPDRMRRDDWMAQARELHAEKYDTSI